MLHEFALRLRFKDFCNNIGHNRTHALQQNRGDSTGQPGLKSLISSARPSRNTFNVNAAVRFERRKDADTKAYGRTRQMRPITLQDCIGSDRHGMPGRRRRRSPVCRHVKVMIAAVGVRIVGAGAPIASPRDHRAIPMNLVHLLILPSFLSNREEPARLQ